MRISTLLCGLAAIAASAPALADDTLSDSALAQAEGDSEDSGDDDMKDILGPTEEDDSVKSETDAVKSGDIGDNVGARKEDVLVVEDETKKKRVIKTIQRKTFLKLGRAEVGPHAAFVANDPFLNRYIFGVNGAYHLTEIFAVEGSFDFAPDLGDSDWKPLTHQLVDENHVSPDISKLTYFGSANFQFSPIYGKVAVVGRQIVNFDIFGSFGMGIAHTSDDLTALQAEGDPRAQATQEQNQPTTSYGGGLRIIFGENFAARIEGKSLVYIETVNSTTLEMKNNFILQAGASFFFPNIKS